MASRRALRLTAASDVARLRRSLPQYPAQLDLATWRQIGVLLAEYEAIRSQHHLALYELDRLTPAITAIRAALNALHRILVEELTDPGTNNQR